MQRQLSLFVLFLMLAGCTGGGGGGGKGNGVDDVPELDATETTGVIRAVVVDEAVRPIAGVLVVLQRGQTAANQTTGEDGFAGFVGLEPGTYFLQAHKPGYTSLPQTVEVVAGIDDPPVAKLLLSAIPGDGPFYVLTPYEGYMQCGVLSPAVSANVCFIANYYPCFALGLAGQACPGNLTQDNSYKSLPFVMDYDRPPDYLQVELVWESTQAASPQLIVRVDLVNITDESIDYANDTEGASPLMVSLNATEMQEYTVGQTHIPALEVFTGGDLAGATVQQQFKYFVTAFYGYLPPADWRFTDGNGVPEPPY